jgi:hypothetical protein
MLIHLLRSCFGASHYLAIAAMVLLTMLAVTRVAWPQGLQTPPVSSPSSPVQSGVPAAPDQPEPQPAEPSIVPKPENPGLFNEIGKLFDKSSSLLPSFPSFKGPQETIDDFNARTRDATDGLSRLTTPSSVVKGRMGCPAAANGAPDCKAGSDKLCQSKGFKEGKSLDTDSAQACSAAALLSGGNREPGNCRTNYYVTRALCQ